MLPVTFSSESCCDDRNDLTEKNKKVASFLRIISALLVIDCKFLLEKGKKSREGRKNNDSVPKSGTISTSDHFSKGWKEER
jgi:hypothetical protein